MKRSDGTPDGSRGLSPARGASASASACLGIALVLSACGPKEDITPQIEVSRDAPGRIALFHRGAHGPIGKQGETEAPVALGPASVRELTDGGGFKGESANAQAGDILLANDEIALALRARGGAPFSIVDVADAKDRADALGAIVPAALGREGGSSTFVVDRQRSFTRDDGAATIIVTGHADAVRITTTLTLEKPDRAVLVSTTLENPGDAPAGPFDVRDEVAWGTARAFVPGHATGAATTGAATTGAATTGAATTGAATTGAATTGAATTGAATTGAATTGGAAGGANERRAFQGPYVGAIGPAVSYALTSTTGEVDATVSAKETFFHLDRALTLAPHSQKSFDRVLVVGGRPDSSSVVAELIRASSGDLGTLTVRFTRTGNAPSSTAANGGAANGGAANGGAANGGAAGARTLVLRPADGEDALTIAANGADDEVVADLPPGRFTVRFVGQDPSAGVAVVVRKDQVTDISLPVGLAR